jgi:hypothetical protein
MPNGANLNWTKTEEADNFGEKWDGLLVSIQAGQ